ncbi:MAG TPA: ABC-three component system protein [Terriglobales bacterium]|jgi:hypothetical protein|nr:ABC-three component system protein [Terriglobales bacterium]
MSSSARHSAPGANAGFTFQFERAFYWLAQSPAGAVVGIETDDDVAITYADQRKILEQDKNSIRPDGQPFGDRSKDLWNTLAIWLDAIETGQITLRTTLFMMVTNKVLPACIAKSINDVKDEAAAGLCIAALEDVGADPPPHIAKLVNRVLQPQSRGVLAQLLVAITLADSENGTAGLELRHKTISHLQIPEWCRAASDSIADELFGWLHKTVVDAWQHNQPAWVQRDHFINQFQAIIARRQRQLIRERAEHLIPVTQESVGKERGRSFVKQIHLVTDDENIVDTSIREFIRCGIEKIRLSEEGNITDEDWLAFEQTLLSRWEKIRARVIRMKKGSSEEDIGFEIFSDTTENYREKLAGSDTEQVYLTSGTYHLLADLLRAGWHPRYKTLVSPDRND